MLSAELITEDVRWEAMPRLDDLCARAIEAAAAHCPQLNDFETVNLLLANDAELTRLNAEFRNKDKATNVLTFPDGEHGHLGDLAVSFERVGEEAQTEGKAFPAHLTHLFIHGLLHCLGYDHLSDEEADEMEGLEIRILAGIGIQNPYQTPD